MSNPGKADAIKKIPDALKESFGIVTDACRRVGVSTETYYDWRKKCPEFKDECERARLIGEERGRDLGESALYKKIQDGDTACIIYFNKSKNKARGYNESVVNHHTFDLGDLSDEELDLIENSIGRTIKLEVVNDDL